jgi:hypothetical protein
MDPVSLLEAPDGSRVAGRDITACRRDEHVDHVFTPLIHECRNAAAADLIDPSTKKRKAGGREIGNRWRKSSLPWNHGLTVCWLDERT